MYKNASICVVVPAFNEEANVACVVEKIPSIVDHIVVVDDGSTDRTSEEVRGIKDSRVTLIRHEYNKGVGAAILTGHKKALDLGADVSAVMAGDDQMDPQYLPMLLDSIIVEGYDLAKGNRFIGAGHLVGMPRHRLFGNFILTFMTKLASGYWHIFDPQNGYTAIRADMLRKLELDRIKKGYQFENDLLIHLGILGARVKDIPIPSRYPSAKSKIRLCKFIPKTAWFLFKSSFRRLYKKYILYDFHPIALLVLCGMPLFFFGLIYSIFLWFSKFIFGLSSPSTGTVMIAVIPLFLGFQLLLTALILDVIETPK